MIADLDIDLAMHDRSNPDMTTARLGGADGVGALLTRGTAVFDASCLAVLLYGLGGEQQGILDLVLSASDLIPTGCQSLGEHALCIK